MAKKINRSKNTITTKSGRTLKVNQTLGDRFKNMKQSKLRRKVERMRGLPKSRLKRFFWRLSPSHLKNYWWSRDGAIMAAKIIGIGILVMFVVMLSVLAYFRKDLPKITDISGDNLGGSISYYDKTGQTLLWQDYSAVKRVPVASENISHYVKDATVAIEDRGFYTNNGFDLKGIFRAAITDILHHSSTQGGSTITQQLVKLTQDFNQNRSITLKIKELILAVEVDRTYTKDQILTGYLNAAPYGGVDYGVQAASSDYFHKNAKDLTLAEAAMLAAIPKSPTYYSPYNKVYFDKKAFLDRQHYVLDVMAQTGKITKAQAEEAKKVDILAEVQPQTTKYAGIQSPYFVLAAKNELLSRCSGENGSCASKTGGWKVTTTMDLNLQHKAEALVADNYGNVSRYGADEEALVVEDVKTGQMAALVGGTDFNNEDHGNINYAQWYISPGSSFKPYDYVSLLDNTTNSGAGSVLYDVQQSLPGYPCTNTAKPFVNGRATGGNCLYDYDFAYPGPLTLRYALGGSRNVPAVKAMLTVGTDKVINVANGLMNSAGAYKCFNPGVDVNTATAADEAQCYGASAIGDGAYLHLDQHVNGLASLARLGVSYPQSYIFKIEDSSNKVIYQWKQPKIGDANVKQVVRPEAAYILNNMASDPNASYLPIKWHNYKGWHNAIKTGTTNNGFDGLMMSWNTQYAVGSWVGYHTRNKTLSTFMENLTTPLTKGMMTYALDSLNTKPESWVEPAGIQHLPAFVVTTHVGVSSVEPSPSTDIFPSWYKPKTGSATSTVTDKVSKKLATTCTPDLAKQTNTGSASDSMFSSDIFYPPGSGGSTTSTSAASDDVHSCSDTLPTVASVFVGDTNVSAGGTATCTTGKACTITATVSAGTHPLDDPQYPTNPGTVNLLLDGAVAQSVPVTASPSTITFTYTTTGSHVIAVQVIDSVLYSAKSTDATLMML